MLTYRFISANRGKFAIPLILFMCLLCYSGQVLAQNSPGSGEQFLKFANVPPGNNVVITSYSPVLSDPQFVCSNPDFKVISFTLSFMPKGKDYYGPFKTNGSKLTEKQIDLFKYFRDQGIEKVVVLLEDIKGLGADGVPRIMSPIIFTIIPR